MEHPNDAPGAAILAAWSRLARLPGGRWVFSRYVGRMAPYTGSIRAAVRDLRAGYAAVALPDRRRVRNHLRSIHAIALANLGELATGLATTTALPTGIRGIPIRLAITYAKKARGTITAECSTATLGSRAETWDHTAVAELRDAEGDLVATVEAVWRLGPA